MFLARGKVGPFRADAEAIAGSDGVTAVRIVLHDEGDGDRAVTAALVPVPGRRSSTAASARPRASRTARTHSAHVSMRRQNSSRVPAKLCMCAMRGHTKRSTLGADS